MTESPDVRKRELAQIHIAKKDLGLDDETYRAVLFTVGRVTSSADLGSHGRKALLEHFKAKGWKPKAAKASAPANGQGKGNSAWDWVNKAAADRQPMLRKIAVMLKEVERPKAYVDGIAEQMFKVQRVEFCDPRQLHKIVTALVKDQQRRTAR